MRLAIVSGGTGGHIYPGLALADEFKRRKIPGLEIRFFGSPEGLEKDVVANAGYRLELIWSRALLRKISFKALSSPFVSLIGFFQALYKLKNFSPDILISTGGFASLPIMPAAKLLGIPIYLQEQNVLPGFTNRLFGRWAQKVFLSFEESKRYLPGLVTGNPIRSSILETDRARARTKLGYSPADKVILVMGGSQGARSLNRAVVSALPKIYNLQLTTYNLQHLRIIHLVGKRDSPIFKTTNPVFYQPIDYLYNVSEALAAADLVISRAGATAIAEFTARGLPMILVPFPFSAEGHQELNAKLIENAGAGLFVKDADFSPEKFIELTGGRDLNLAAMSAAAKKIGRPLAAQKIVESILHGS